MRLNNVPNVPTQVSSKFVNIETYVQGSNLIISKADGDSTFIGRCYEMNPLTGGGREFSLLIKNMFKMASDDSLISVSLVNYPDYDVPYLLTKGKTFGNPMLTELVHRQAKLYENALNPGALAGIPAINKKTVFISFMMPVKAVNEATLEAALDAQNEFLSGLKGCGFHDARALTPKELLGVYRLFGNIYAPRQDVAVDDVLDLRQQTFGPSDTFDFSKSDYAMINDTYCAAVVPKSFPEEVSHGLMNLLIGAPLTSGSTKEGGGQRVKTPFIITASVRVANQYKESVRVDRALKSRTGKKAPFSLGVEDTESVVRDLEYMQKTCSDGSNKYTYASLTAFVFAKTRSDMVEARTTIKATLDNLAFDGRNVKDTIGIRFVQSLPLNFSPLINEKLRNEALMPASAAACLLPIFGDYQGNADLTSQNTGTVLITERGSPYYFDPFRTNANKNGTLAAKGGAGKSVFAQNMILSNMAEGTKVIFFDNGRSTKKFCKAVGGDFVEFDYSSAEKPSLNPFSNLTEEEFEEQHEMIASLILKMAYFNEDIEAGARIAVSEAVKASWGSKHKNATISMVIDSLETIKNSSHDDRTKSEVAIAATNLIPRLKNFIESPARGAYFQGRSTIDPKNLFTVYELSGLDGDDHLKQCVLFFVMNQLMRTVKKDGGRKLIMLDESWQLIRDHGAASVMEGLYRKARKDGGSIWVITQSPRDLSGNPTGKVILSQSVWKLVMEQEAEEVDLIVSEGVMTEFKNDGFFARSIKDVHSQKGLYSGILICGGGSYERVRLYIDRFTATLFSTESEERDIVFKAMNDGVDPVDAVDMLIGETSRKRKKWLKEIMQQLRVSENMSDDEIRKEIAGVMGE